jgi:hypothetical protein
MRYPLGCPCLALYMQPARVYKCPNGLRIGASLLGLQSGLLDLVATPLHGYTPIGISPTVVPECVRDSAESSGVAFGVGECRRVALVESVAHSQIVNQSNWRVVAGRSRPFGEV